MKGTFTKVKFSLTPQLLEIEVLLGRGSEKEVDLTL